MAAPIRTPFPALGILALAIPVLALGQSRPPSARDTTASIVGTIVDASTGKPVAQAQVALRGAARRALSDLNGNFTLRAVAPARYVLDVRRIGYTALSRDSVEVRADAPTRVTIAIRPVAFRLAEVTIAPGSFTLLDAAPTGGTALSRASIESAPFGEDLFRAVSRLPGLSSGDYGAHFSIRGGRSDETLILLDGLELYEPFHLKDFNDGALSIIDVDAIDGVELLTGGFSARYGDKRSGVMNIALRTPRKDSTHVSLGANFSNAHALAEGTFAAARGSWLISGRRGFVDLLLGIINKKETRAPTYEDVTGTLRFQLGPAHALALNVLHASDRYRFAINGTTGFNDSIKTRESANNSYGNSYAWLTLRSLYGPHLSVRSLLSAGRVGDTRIGDEYRALTAVELYGVNGHRNFSVFSLKQDYSYQRTGRVIVDWGFDARVMHANYDWTNRLTQNPDNPTADTTGFYPRVTRRTKVADGRTLGAYVSNRLQLFDPFTVELGLRYDGATYSHDSDWSPRVNARFALSDRVALRAGWGLYRQRQGIADENAFDRLNRYFPSELSKQWTLSVERRLNDEGLFRVEAYRKLGSYLRPVLRNWKSGLNVFPESAEDRILVFPSANSSTGLELYFDGRVGSRARVRAGYALSFVDETVRRIEQVNDPLQPPFAFSHPGPQDQRHSLNADLSYRLWKNWAVTTALTLHSGWPFTDQIGVPVRRRNGTTDLAVRPDSLYGARLPFYQRVDVRLTHRRQTANGEVRFFAEVINATNHANVLGYDVFRVQDPGGTLRLERVTETFFSILPSLGIAWSRRF